MQSSLEVGNMLVLGRQQSSCDSAEIKEREPGGSLVSHSLLYSSCVVTKLLDNPLAPSPRVLASTGKLGAM